MVHEACTSKTRITHMFYIAVNISWWVIFLAGLGEGGSWQVLFYSLQTIFWWSRNPSTCWYLQKKVVSYDNLFRAIVQLYRKGWMISELFSNPFIHCFCLGFCNLLQVITLINAKKKKEKSSFIMLLHSVAFAVKGCYYLSIFQT